MADQPSLQSLLFKCGIISVTSVIGVLNRYTMDDLPIFQQNLFFDKFPCMISQISFFRLKNNNTLIIAYHHKS